MVRKLNLSLALLALALIALPVLADEASEKALTEKKLVLKAPAYVLDGETEFNKEMAMVRQNQQELERAKSAHRTFEKKVSVLKGRHAYLQDQVTQLQAKRAQPNTKEDFTRLNNEIAKLQVELNKLNKEKMEKEKESQAKVDKAQDTYIQKVQATMKLGDTLTEQYAALAKDEAVKTAIDAINTEKKTKNTLGPTKQFENNYKNLKVLHTAIQSGEITLRKEGGVMWVDVKVNNKPTQSMVLDTGASTISLPHDVAAGLGIVVTEAHPAIKMQQANGSLIDGRIVTLETVQLGNFTLTDIECVVLDKAAIAAQPLFGNSFLKYFIYRIDPDSGKLLLTKKESAPDADDKKDKEKEKKTAVEKKPAPAAGGDKKPAKPADDGDE